MAHLLPALFAGLLAAGATAATWLRREAAAVLRHVPRPVAALLRDPALRNALGRLILQVAGYANLTNEQRRQRALQLVRAWLEHHGVHLSDSELALLVELLYAWVKREFPAQIAPEPLDLGGTVGGRSAA